MNASIDNTPKYHFSKNHQNHRELFGRLTLQVLKLVFSAVLMSVVTAQAQSNSNSNHGNVLPTKATVAQASIDVLGPAYTLEADTLFEFDRADRAAMTDAGTRAIDMLVSRLSQNYSRIERLNLIGHADPLGSAERNDRLAIERVLTVPITVEGRGSREPVEVIGVRL